jgi:hypothetical protein
LLALGAVSGVIHQTMQRVVRGFYAEHGSWRDAPRLFLSTSPMP